MKKQHRDRAAQLIALVFGYLRYNAAIHRVVVRALS